VSRTHPELDRVNWYGLKRLVKRALALRPVNAPLLRLIGAVPPLRHRLSRFPVGLSEVAYAVNDSKSVVMLDPLSCSVAKDIYWGRGQRSSAADRVADRVFASLALEADWMLDIGAYTGFFALLTCAVNPSARAIAFEIVPETYLLLWRNIIRNDRVGRIDARLAGLGAPGDSMRIPSHLGCSELPSSISRRYEFGGGVRVPFATLDDLVNELQGRVLMKVDIEGTEEVLFRHGREFLVRHRPSVLCEVLVRSTSAPFLTALFTELGYRLYRVTATGLREESVISPDGRFKDWYFSQEEPKKFVGRAL
jgi:FkbM family methyltransferase